MAYTKQTWIAPTGTGLSRYAKSGETDTHIELALDPVNLTNTPTPVTVARLNHMEEGIAKAYDTAPPTPWAQYSGKDIPQLPDNVAGTTYKRDNDWTTVDGWYVGGGATLTVQDGYIRATRTGTSTFGLQRVISGSANKLVVLIIRAKTPSSVFCARPAGELYAGKMIGTDWTVYSFIKTASIDDNAIYIYSQGDAGSYFDIKSIYIGTGAYDRLVFDNSYHYRHLLNNAVVPTPQGLYFNGATSYLRSKEKITLPDVFTFSATVNCAVKNTSQVFILHGNPGTANNRVYVCRDTSSNTLFIKCSETSLTEVTFFTGVNYFLGLDNTDIDVKVEINFINQTIKVYRDGIQFGTTVSAPSMVKPVANNLYIGNSNTLGSPFLGYMRNICIFDTALTDTHRNWLAQGNTPPILYDVTNYETEGYVSIQDADGTNTGVEAYVDSNGNRTLKLPATIKGNLTGNASTASKANVRVSLRHGNTWFGKTWAGLTDFNGNNIWTDGENVYYSYEIYHYVLNKSTSTWVAKTWSGLTSFIGYLIWTDGDNIYYSNATNHFVLNKATSTWTAKTWTGLTDFYGNGVWTDGDNIYYSNATNHFVLNKATSTWTAKTWTGLTDFYGNGVWTDGDNIYHSNGISQHVLNKATSAWVVKTWTGLTNFSGSGIWTDGENIYNNNGTNHYVLNKATSAWVAKTWTGSTDFSGDFIWTDGDNIYYSFGTTHFVLPATRHNYVDDDKYNSLFGTVTTCGCATLSNRFIFSNE